MRAYIALTAALVSATAGAQTPTETPPPTPVVLPREPIAGYSGGTFFLKDPNDWFVVFPKARVHIDWYNFLNRGDLPAGVENNSSSDPRPRNTIFLRRARVGVGGTIAKHWDYTIEGEFASAPVNGQYGNIADAFVIMDYSDYIKVQAGQFNSNFMLENRTSNRIIHYMERSIAVRSVGSPQNKDLGGQVFGWLPKHLAYYSFGLYNGESVQNIRNQDNNLLILARGFVAPFATLAQGKRQWLEHVWVGGSFWWQKSTNLGGPVGGNVGGAAQNDLPGMTTQGGVTFLPTNYRNGADAMGNTVRAHLVPNGETIKGAVEVNLPVTTRLGARFELVYESQHLNQYNDVNAVNALIKRNRVQAGLLEGTALYAEVWGWVIGDHSVMGMGGLSTATRVKPFKVSPEPKWGLQLLAKYENVNLRLSGLPQGVDAMGMAKDDPAVGNYLVHTFEFGVNAWFTKHIRLTGNYVMNYIDGDAGNVKSNYFYRRAEHELLFRLQLAI